MSWFDLKKRYTDLFNLIERGLIWTVAASGLGLISVTGYQTYFRRPSLDMVAKPGQLSEKNNLQIDRIQWSFADEKKILDRNIFNSEGTISDGFEQTTQSNLSSGALVKSDLPLKLEGIIFAGDPFNGLALIKNTEKNQTNSYLVGDTVTSEASLAEVYEDRVILKRGGGREYIELERFEIARQTRRSNSLKADSKNRSLSKITVSENYQEDGFERKGSTILISEEFKRSLISPDSMAKVLQDAKAEPNIVGGEIRGFKLTRIREDSIYLKAGFLDGDIVEEINGIPLRDAAGAIRLLQQLKNAKSIEARVKRGGNSFDMSINIQ